MLEGASGDLVRRAGSIHGVPMPMTVRARFAATRPLAALALLLAASPAALAQGAAAPELAAILATYADIALAGYEDALEGARALDAATDALIADPSDETLRAARDAWIAARPAYQETEVYRFGNPIVDDWEGRVNAWPLDEGLIDYVDASYGTESDVNDGYTANIVANPTITVGGAEIDAAAITPALLQDQLQEAGRVEANVATGYHAVEFLLWGQDLNDGEAGAGERPATDFATDGCTNGNCDRRAAYLDAATDLLVTDLEEMVANWTADGEARASLLTDTAAGLSAMLTGMGSLSYGELAGERMKLGLLLHDPEEEHDCFSDMTHLSHLHDAIGIRNVYLGTYARAGGGTVEGASLSSLVAASDPALDAEMRADLDASVSAMQAIADAAEGGEPYDLQIGEGNAEGNARVQAAIDALVKQTRTVERIVAGLDLGNVTIEGSDSLDNTEAVFQ